jgi:MFS family permease
MGSLDNRWWVLAGSCTGLFVLMLDSTVVVLALPAIRSDLNASTDGLQWIQNAYLLTLAATVVTAGRLGDIRGRRRGSPRVCCGGDPLPGAILTWLLVRAPATPTTPPPGALEHHRHHRRFHL